jgi:hypothetical protein
VRIRLLTAGLAAAAILSACGSSDSPAPTTGTETTGHHGGYAECLAEHGVTTPPMGPGAPPGVDADTWGKASAACADKAPGPES